MFWLKSFYFQLLRANGRLIHLEDELSFKEMRMCGQYKISLCFLWLVWIKRNGRQGEYKITNTNGGKLLRRPSSRYKKLLDRVAFWIVYIARRVGYKMVAYNATSVEVGRRNRLFLCMCTRNCISLIVIINIIVYIDVAVECQDWQVIRPNKCKHEISDSLHYSNLLCPVLLYKVMYRSTGK